MTERPDPLRLLVISFVTPGARNGGEIVLERHLCNDPDIKVLVVPRDPQPGGLRARLHRTRLARRLNDLAEMKPIRPLRGDLEAASAFKPDAILTVAQHTEYRRALGLARRLRLPLITFFHDLWPTMVNVTPAGRRAAWTGFRKLAAESTLALCVSENMLAALDWPQAGRVLLPIPGRGQPPSRADRAPSPLKVGYSGSLFDYGPSIGAIAEEVLSRPDIRLTIRGRDPDWSPQQLARLTRTGIYQPPLDRNAYEGWMAGLDAHICPLVFDAPHEPFVRTSFPSKLLEMLRFGRPVLLWGPSYAAGVQWALEHDAAMVITSPNPSDVTAGLERLAKDRGLYEHFSQASKRVSGLFSYERLHAEFRRHVFDALAIRGTPP